MKSLALAALLITTAFPAFAAEPNAYIQTNLVANKKNYKPTFEVDKKLINAWGIAIRPAGKGGHFWVTGKDISFEYVGDVAASNDATLQKLHADELKYVKLPVGGDDKFATGVVFSDSKDSFVIHQGMKNGVTVSGPAKFLFASDGGIISAWTERKKEDGTFDRPNEATTVIDESKNGAQFFGLAINKNYDRIYAADFGQYPRIHVFGGDFQAISPKPNAPWFNSPFDDNKNGKVDAGEYAPFNVQAIGDSIFVAYAKTQPCPKAEIKSGACKEGEIFAGEEDTSKTGYGKLAEFDEGGNLVAVWNDGGKLSAPWGLAVAPEDFGALSGALLVANFGDGTIAGYNHDTREFIDVMRDAKGKPIAVDKIWGLIFGNGESLGDKNALYFAAGPKDENDGVFGSLRLVRE